MGDKTPGGPPLIHWESYNTADLLAVLQVIVAVLQARNCDQPAAEPTVEEYPAASAPELQEEYTDPRTGLKELWSCGYSQTSRASLSFLLGLRTQTPVMRAKWKSRWPSPSAIIDLEDCEDGPLGDVSAALGHSCEDETAEACFGDEVKDEALEAFNPSILEEALGPQRAHEAQYDSSLVPLPAEGDPGLKRARYGYVDGDRQALGSSDVSALGPAVQIPAEVIAETIKNTEFKQFKYPWEKGRLAKIFSNKTPLDSSCSPVPETLSG